MAYKKGKLDESTKMAILTLIKEKKSVLFGIFTTELENSTKKQAWNDILLKAQSLGACSASRTWEFVRDSLWGSWKSRTLAKRDNANKTGRGGGKECVMTAVDEIIIDIVGRDTPGVVGLNLPQTGEARLGVQETNTVEAPINTQATIISADDSEGQHCEIPVIPQKQSRKSKEADLLQKKRKLQVELLELEIYNKKLMCLGMERTLRVEQSEITKGLKTLPFVAPAQPQPRHSNIT